MIEDRNETIARSAPGDGLALRRALRSRTHASHERLDALFEGMMGAEEPSAYHRFIRMNEVCHRVIEPVLAASGLARAVPGWRPAARSPALAADLAAMGLAPLPALPFALARPDVAEALGIAYVLEGSRLGAGMIFAALGGRDRGGAWVGASFHYLAGPDEPHALRRLLGEGARVVAGEAETARCVRAANATFDHFLAADALARAPAGACA